MIQRNMKFIKEGWFLESWAFFQAFFREVERRICAESRKEGGSMRLYILRPSHLTPLRDPSPSILVTVIIITTSTTIAKRYNHTISFHSDILHICHPPCPFIITPQLTLPFWNAVPKVQSPYVANKLSRTGNGFPPVLTARGIELPARMMEARSASSTP